MAELEQELRGHLTSLVHGEEGLRAFQSWFVPAFWDETYLDPSAVRLARQVELAIAEYTSGVWTLDEVKDVLHGLLGSPVVEAKWWDENPFAPRVVTGTAAVVIRSSRVPQGPEAERLEPVRIRFAAALG
jgi:hypothetical protein